MEAAVTTKAKSKRQPGHADHEPAVATSTGGGRGAAAGMPLFLQRSAFPASVPPLQRQVEEPAEEIEEEPQQDGVLQAKLFSTTPPPVQRQEEEPEETEEEPTELLQAKLLSVTPAAVQRQEDTGGAEELEEQEQPVQRQAEAAAEEEEELSGPPAVQRQEADSLAEEEQELSDAPSVQRQVEPLAEEEEELSGAPSVQRQVEPLAEEEEELSGAPSVQRQVEPLAEEEEELSGAPSVQRQVAEPLAEEEREEEERPEGFVQTKLTVGKPGDVYEQEADQVAATAMRMPESPASPAGADLCPECQQKLQRQPLSTTPLEEEGVQRLCSECQEKLLHRKPLSAAGSTPSGGSAIPVPDTGSPLSSRVREKVEPVVGTDLSDVRVHSGPAAQESAKGLHAKAFTHRGHIWMGSGQSSDDLELMAHEATHTVQQMAGGPSKPAGLQRQAEEGADSADQEFSFSEEEMENRLTSTPAEGADTSGQDVELAPQTESNLDEVEAEDGEEARDKAQEKEGEGTEGEEETEEGAGEGEGGEAAGLAEAAGAPAATAPPPPPTPGPAAEYEGIVDDEVGSYMGETASGEQLAPLDQTTATLVEAAQALGEQEITEPDSGSFLGNLTGITPLADSLTRVSPGYEDEATWLQVIAQIRDITSALGGVVGMIGLVATVTGLILSLLIPPVGAFLLTVGRFCDVAALILDAVSLVCGIFLTSWNLYRLKNETDPEEKARLLALVRQDAVKTLMSGVAVATAAAPGLARKLGDTSLGRAASSRFGRITTAAGERMAGMGRKLRGSQALSARALVAVGRAGKAAGRGLAYVPRRLSGGVHRLAEKARRTTFIRNLNTRAASWQTRFLNKSGRGLLGRRFVNRYRANRDLAGLLQHQSNVRYHIDVGDRLKSRLRQLERQGLPPNQIRAQLANEFNVNQNALFLRNRNGRLSFGRGDSAEKTFLLNLRKEEFRQVQQMRANNPRPSGVSEDDYARELADLLNQRPDRMAHWTPGEIRQFLSDNALGRMRTRTGALRVGKVSKTPHHTIPVNEAPHLKLDPEHIQFANAPVLARRWYGPSFEGSSRHTLRQTLGANAPPLTMVRGRQNARNLIRSGQVTGITDPRYFESRQFYRELAEQGQGGLWRNPNDPGQFLGFGEHFTKGHHWNTGETGAGRIFGDMAIHQEALHGEATRRFFGSASRATARTGLPTYEGATGDLGDLIDRALGRSSAYDESMSVEIVPPSQQATAGTSTAPADGGAAEAGAAEGGTGGSSTFLAALAGRLAAPLVRLGNAGLGSGPSPAPAGPAAAPVAGGERAAAERPPEPPPASVPYSPDDLVNLRESRISVVGAIETVQAYIAQTQQSQRDNELAREAAGVLKAHRAADRRRRRTPGHRRATG